MRAIPEDSTPYQAVQFLGSTSDGTLLSNTSLGVSGAQINSSAGSDISVNNGIVALNPTDAGVNEPVLRFDSSSNLIGSFAPVGLDIVTSLDFDATSGILYGIHVDADNGNNGLYLAVWAPDGTLLSNIALGASGVDINSSAGSDIAVHTLVPEPSSLLLLITFAGSCLLRLAKS